MIFIRISQLDDNLKSHILSYIPSKELLWVQKKIYLTNHHYIDTEIKVQKRYESYIRHIIRKDLDFVLCTILKTIKNHHWSKKYQYRNSKYQNYYHFMDCFAFENNAFKCRSVLFTNVFKKKYKKIQRHIGWTN